MEEGEDRDMHGGEGRSGGGHKADSTAGNNEDGSGVGGGYRKQAVTTEFDCCLCYAILESVTASTDGVGVGVGGERGEPTSR